MANNNKYSGQPTYSRDVCSMMRRINALEARLSWLHGEFSAALDFDVSDGRVYVLMEVASGSYGANYHGHRIYVHDMATGDPVDEFEIPLTLTGEVYGSHIPAAPVSEYFDIDARATSVARPRMCVGGGYVFMGANRAQAAEPGSGRHFVTGQGRIYRFSTNGDGLQDARGWPTIETSIPSRGGMQPGHCFGSHFFDYNEMNADPFHSTVPGLEFASTAFQSWPNCAQMHYVNGRVWGMMVGLIVGGVFEAPNGKQHLCWAEADLSAKGRVPWGLFDGGDFSYGEYTDAEIGIGGTFCRGALAVHDDKLYFDATNAADASMGPSGNTTAPFFGSIGWADHETGEADFIHSRFELEELSGGYLAAPHALYATDGTYLFAWHDVFFKQYRFGIYSQRGTKEGLKRFTLATGAYLDTWGADEDVGEVLQMRVYDGVLWMLEAMGDAEGYRARISARDTVTMTMILWFYVGSAVAQTEFHAYTTSDASYESLGTPDGGVSVPDDEGLVTAGAIKSALHITDMRDALKRLCVNFLAPSGERLHLNGTDDTENLYILAMGDRTNYGATGGALTNWTRDRTQMEETTRVFVPEDSVNVYRCIREHVAAATNRPATGGQWADYWERLQTSGVGTAGVDWTLGMACCVHKTYDIDIGEVDECLTLLENSSLARAPQG